ncbi:hypothetical protein [Flaviaesturariibacter aridisoli]|uniref:Lipocalin-like domain-containing protein n=1 Tax=Flaviaesturariibacter aridisoli TaxID=2545761 RepID=A0A4R4DYF7_9BACT|nr:hypothetical protein [Flaviaesturariibacter aridisoli]TCZ68648.1 hypothetical protein E0486_13605 [Flaviaesturariibacter aridisoli]
MTRLTALLFLPALLALGSCKKYIEDKQEEAAVEIITNGRWKISSFSTGSTDQLALFNNYLFQFNANSTVDAFYNGTMQLSGGWTYDIPARTVTGNFPTSSDPLALINGTWTVTNSTQTTVDAERSVNGETRRMHMDKQ